MEAACGFQPSLMHLFPSDMHVTGSKQLAITAVRHINSPILQSADSGDASQGGRVFREYENPFMMAIVHPAEEPCSQTLNPQTNPIQIWFSDSSVCLMRNVDERISGVILSCVYSGLMKGTRCIVHVVCCWQRVTFCTSNTKMIKSRTSTALVKKISLYVDDYVFHVFLFFFLKKIMLIQTLKTQIPVLSVHFTPCSPPEQGLNVQNIVIILYKIW